MARLMPLVGMSERLAGKRFDKTRANAPWDFSELRRLFWGGEVRGLGELALGFDGVQWTRHGGRGTVDEARWTREEVDEVRAADKEVRRISLGL